MWGAIAGDVVGSAYEAAPIKQEEFALLSPRSRFTDDTVLTVAVAEALLRGRDYAGALRAFARRYPDAGYGGMFVRWVRDPASGAYGSWANGAAMRVTPVGWACGDAEEVLQEAARSAQATHDHPDAVDAAQAVALAVFLGRTGAPPETIRAALSQRFGYALDRSIAAIRPGYHFDVSARGSVPEAIVAALEAHSVESAIRKAVSLGGDSDTQACIAGGIAQAIWGSLPGSLLDAVAARLPAEFLSILEEFYTVYGISLSRTDA